MKIPFCRFTEIQYVVNVSLSNKVDSGHLLLQLKFAIVFVCATWHFYDIFILYIQLSIYM